MQRPGRSIGAVVVAGGLSKRMGFDKALLRRSDGQTLLSYVVSCLTPIIKRVVVAGGSPRHCQQLHSSAGLPADVAIVSDVQGVTDNGVPPGPLAGIAAGLSGIDATYALVLSCDLPALRADLITSFVSNVRRDDSDADIYTVVAQGLDQPLFSIYRCQLALLARQLVACGEGAPRALLAQPHVSVVRIDGTLIDRTGDVFKAMNTPAEARIAGLVLPESDTMPREGV